MKIDFDDKACAAQLLFWRMKERLEMETKMCTLKQEKDAERKCLFYWILSRIYVQMESNVPTKSMIGIKITGRLRPFNKASLRHEDNEYIPFYVDGRTLFDITKEMVDIFNDLDSYFAQFYSISEEECEFTVSMSI